MLVHRADLLLHAAGSLDGVDEEQFTEAPTLKRLVHGKTPEPNAGNAPREAFSCGCGQVCRVEFGDHERVVAADPAWRLFSDRDGLGQPSRLVLANEALEPVVPLDTTAVERPPVMAAS